jgi:hypothetical protein
MLIATKIKPQKGFLVSLSENQMPGKNMTLDEVCKFDDPNHRPDYCVIMYIVPYKIGDINDRLVAVLYIGQVDQDTDENKIDFHNLYEHLHLTSDKVKWLVFWDLSSGGPTGVPVFLYSTQTLKQAIEIIGDFDIIENIRKLYSR